MKLGVLGGTFDPPHLAHLIVAQEVLDVLRLDRILFVPTGIPPLKSGDTARGNDRARMVELAIAGNPAFEASRLEIDRPGVSYTVDTLKQLQEQYRPDAELYFITGADQLLQLRAWHAPEQLLQLTRLVAVTRPGYTADLSGLDQILPGATARAIPLAVPLIGISATEIRRRLAAGRTIRYLVPEAVREYIEARGLYR